MPNIFRRCLVPVLSLWLSAAGAAELPTEAVVLERVAGEQRFEGVIEAVQRATVSAQTSGRIVEILFDVDDYVERGAVLLRFHAAEPEARYQQANAALEEARARLTEARNERARIAGIYARQLVAKAAMDKADAELKAAQARFESAEARLTETAEQREHTIVRAPYAGIVVERHVELGELANPGQPLMTGISLEQLRAVTGVPQRYIAAVRELATARVYAEGIEPIAGESLTVSPYAEAGAHSFRVRVNLPAGSHGLYPGMLVKVGFESGMTEHLLIPARALVRRSEVTAVYVVEADGTVRFRQVRAGAVLPDGRQLILAGLSEGERVALDPIQAGGVLKQQAAGTAP
jgi:membrane fusion protein, multidrug efflux system